MEKLKQIETLDSGKFVGYIEFILTVMLFVERMESTDNGHRTAH